jgi:hypothetical protein
MGLAGRYTPDRRMARQLLICAGLLVGGYLGWAFARGPITGSDFLPPTDPDHYTGALVCAILGVAANLGTIWTMRRFTGKPLKLLSVLLFLLLIMLAAVTAVTLLTSSGIDPSGSF